MVKNCLDSLGIACVRRTQWTEIVYGTVKIYLYNMHESGMVNLRVG